MELRRSHKEVNFFTITNRHTLQSSIESREIILQEHDYGIILKKYLFITRFSAKISFNVRRPFYQLRAIVLFLLAGTVYNHSIECPEPAAPTEVCECVNPPVGSVSQECEKPQQIPTRSVKYKSNEKKTAKSSE